MKALNGLSICFLTGSLGQGGAERQLFYQLQTLKRCGSKPFVISFSSGEYWQTKIETMGIPVFTLSTIHSKFSRIIDILRILNTIQPHIVQSAHFYANLYSIVGARFLRIKEIGAVRNNAKRDILDMGTFSGSWSLSLPRILAVNSRSAIQHIESRLVYPPQLFYLPNVVNTEKFSPALAPLGEKIHLVMVGRFVLQKRFDLFLNLLAKLRTAGYSVVGHLVGDGPDRPKLESLAKQLGLGPDVGCFHGSVDNVEHIYHQSHICLHLSDWEGMPNTVLEAMACGLPVIASHVGGIPEIIKHGSTGFLVEPGDMTQTMINLQKLLQDNQLRIAMGSAARSFVEQNHSLDDLPMHLEKLYMEAQHVKN